MAPERPETTWSRLSRERRLRTVLIAAGCSRLGLVLVGVCALAMFGESPARPTLDAAAGPLPPWLAIWYRWDAYWYVLIAERGYGGALHNSFADLRANFLPAYPALVATVGHVTNGPVIGALLVSNVAFVIFLAGLWRLVAEQCDPAAADRAVWLYCLFPTSFFLSGIYTESLMLAAAVWGLVAARSGHWMVSGLYAAVATLSRPTGFLVTLMIALVWLDTSRGADRHRRVGQLASVLLPTAATVALYLVMASAVFGDTWAGVSSHAQAGRVLVTAPWERLQQWTQGGMAFHGYERSWIDTTAAVGAVLTVPFVFCRLGVAQGVYTAGCVLVPLATGTISFLRLVLVAFPALVLIAARLRTSGWETAVLAVCSMLAGLAMALFATWHWIA